MSCTKKEPSTHTKTIGVTLLTRAHIFYKDLEEGVQEEAAKNKYEVFLTAAEFDLGKQTAQKETT